MIAFLQVSLFGDSGAIFQVESTDNDFFVIEFGGYLFLNPEDQASLAGPAKLLAPL